MKTFLSGILAISSVIISINLQASVATFEGLTSPYQQAYSGGGSYWTGNLPAGPGSTSSQFTSGDGIFKNNYTDGGGYYFWDGWSYSNTTDTTTAGFTNQYSAITGQGAEGSATYAISTPPFGAGGNSVELTHATRVNGMYVTNTTYAALSMLNGDFIAKQFGGVSGNDADWFKLSIRGIKTDNSLTAAIDFYLADFRESNNANDYIVTDWEWVDLSSLGRVKGLEFSLLSSDVGSFGMNTPAYFAMDNLTTVPLPAGLWLLASGMLFLSLKRKNIS